MAIYSVPYFLAGSVEVEANSITEAERKVAIDITDASLIANISRSEEGNIDGDSIMIATDDIVKVSD